MFDHSDQSKAPQRTFIHYVLQMALDEINTLSDTLRAIQPSRYAAEKATIVSLAALIHEKTQNIKNLMDELTNENRSILHG